MSAPAALSSPPQTVRRSPLLLALWPWLAAIASGAMLVLCYPPWNQGWLCWIALTPLLFAALSVRTDGKRRWLRPALLGYVTGWVFFVGTFWWLATLEPLFGSRFLYSLPALLALYMSLYFAIWCWLVACVFTPGGNDQDRFKSSLRNLWIGCVAAGAWIALEYLRTWVLGGFGWNPLGVALHQDLAMIQIVDITGVPGLSFLIAFVNLMVVIIIRRIISEFGPVFLTRIRWEFSATMALVAFVFAYGVRELMRRDPGPTVQLRAAAIQPNIPQNEKHDPTREDTIFAQLDRLTGLAEAAKPSAQLFIWPEAATPHSMFADEMNYRFVIDQSKRTGTALLLGTTDFDPALREDYNISALVTENGEKQQLYRKMHLVPFGEYLPLRPVSTAIVGMLVPSDFTPGTEYTVLQMADPKIRLATLICFEDTLGDLTRHFVDGGAQLLVNITNDGWFAKSPAAEQHLANAIFRAVENRRPLIRCGNTGVTCSVDAHGVVERWMKPFEEGFSIRSISVPTQTATTFYTRHGDWLTALSAALVAVAGIARMRSRKPNPSPSVG